MVFRRLHLGTVAYGTDSMDEVQSHVFSAYTQVKKKTSVKPCNAVCLFKEEKVTKNKLNYKNL